LVVVVNKPAEINAADEWVVVDEVVKEVSRSKKKKKQKKKKAKKEKAKKPSDRRWIVERFECDGAGPRREQAAGSASSRDCGNAGGSERLISGGRT
jgi:hypothetical protein